ncbi:piggyBac transposable element-derived protein 4-like, partial [Aplysia californica]|uniref:PiggyBac transposable element-derived protein 4-like n=1 Tax=Aplysia californica TaxID=6500 RepID=A0ABM0KBD7_APLCA
MAAGGDEAGPSSGRRQRFTAQQALGLFQTLASDDNLARESEVEFSDGGSDSDGERNAMNFESDSDSSSDTEGSAARPRPQTHIVNNAATDWVEISQNLGLDLTPLHLQNILTTRNEFGDPLPPRSNRRQVPGVNANLDQSSSPLDCLKVILTQDIIEDLVKSTNEYAEKRCMPHRPSIRKRSVYHTWEKVSEYEMVKFFCVLIAMGLEVRPSVRDYWSTEEIMYNAFYHTMFRRERFESIYHTMLHCSDPDSENKHKIEPLIDAVMEASREAFYSFQNLSIDEMVVGFTGRWKFKQYNPSKPKKYHIKTFGLVDSTTGFVLRVFPYFGRDTSYNPELDHDSGMAIKVFDTLLTDVGTGHHIFADRYYTTEALVRYLSGRSLYYTGTLNLNRKNFPPQLKNIKTMKHMEAKHYLRNDESMLITAWKDKKAKKPCVLVSTKADTSFLTNARNKTKPAVVNNYNMSMGGCDKVDQRVTYYSNTDRKSYKWWKKLFFWIFEIAQNNAFVLYALTREQGTAKMSMKAFKLKLLKQLQDKAATLMPAEEVENHTPKRKKPRETNPVDRFQGSKHLIQWTGKDRDCVYCSEQSKGKRKRTTFICSGCENRPYLCAKICFE